MRACTVIARNYVPQARVMVESLRAHHPEVEIDVLVVDAVGPDHGVDVGPGATVVPFDELALDAADRSTMRAIYDVLELCTAVKPALLRQCQGRTPDGVAVYLDPDVAVLAPLDGLADLASSSAGPVLTPHALTPIPDDGRLMAEGELLHAGAFNLGFVAVGPDAAPFLDWWGAHLRTDALIDHAGGLFTDQKWIDLVPVLFPPAIVRDPGWNVAYWNLHERRVAHDERGWKAGGVPLRFFHFSGYDPSVPHLLSKYQGRSPRIELSTDAELAALVAWYDARLRAHGWSEHRAVPYGWSTVAGHSLPTWLRRAIRAHAVEPGFGGAAPDPFADEAGFLDWLSEPIAVSRTRALTRLLGLYWSQRADLQTVFPYASTADLDRYVDWVDSGADARFVADVGPLHRGRTARPAAAAHDGFVAGTTVVGHLGAALGVGTTARLVARAAAASGLPVDVVADDRVEAAATHTVHVGAARTAGAALAVVVANADAIGGMLARRSAALSAGARIAGLFSWELERFGRRDLGALGLVDEVWVLSAFVADALRPDAGDVPVRVFPLPIVADPPTPLRRADLGLPDDRYVFATIYDTRSVVARKNPAGAIEAHVRAFGPDDGAVLVVKTMFAERDPAGHEQLRCLARGRPDVVVVDEVWSPARTQALVQLADCVVSLHRSEGYGQVLAQAMAQGRPVVATGWSGNLEFMDESTAALVPFDLVPVGSGCEPYPADGRWAEPDVDAAAEAMRRFAGDPAAGARVGAAAQASVLARFPLDRAGRFVHDAALAAATERRDRLAVVR